MAARLLGRSLIFLLATLSQQVASAEASGLQWLQRMAEAIVVQNYSAVVMYGDNGRWESALIRQAHHDDVRIQRTDYLTGPARAQTRTGNDLVCTHEGPHTPGITPDVLKPFNSRLFSYSDSLEELYSARRLPGNDTRIAGRSALAISVTPVYPDRYGYLVWLDTETALPLKAEVLNLESEVLQRFQFASLDIGVNSPISELTDTDAGHTVHLNEGDEAAAEVESEWVPDWLPDGFVMQRYRVAGHSERMMFSDGLAAFTLFVDPTSEQHSISMSHQWGPVSATVKEVRHGDRRYRLSAVGELPTPVLIQVLDSVSPAPSLAYH